MRVKGSWGGHAFGVLRIQEKRAQGVDLADGNLGGKSSKRKIVVGKKQWGITCFKWGEGVAVGDGN